MQHVEETFKFSKHATDTTEKLVSNEGKKITTKVETERARRTTTTEECTRRISKYTGYLSEKNRRHKANIK